MKILGTILLLIVSNTFMTVAWYGHLKHNRTPLVLAILASWGIAFFEYVFQVSANRLGSGVLTLTQLKIIQEAITLTVFTVFAFVQFGEKIRWNNIVSMLLILAAVGFAFLGGGSGRNTPTSAASEATSHESK